MIHRCAPALLLAALALGPVRAGHLDIEALDKQGQAVEGLPVDAIEVSLDGRPVEVREAVPGPPLSVALLMDVSDPAIPHQDTLRRAAERFVAALREEDEAMVIAFGASTGTVVPFSSDHLETRRRILSRSLQAANAPRARLWDGLEAAVAQAATRDGRRAVVVFTYGADDGSRAQPGAVLEQAQAAGVRLDFLHLPRPRAWSGGYWRQRTGELEILARGTGGGVRQVREPDDFMAAYEDLASRLTHGLRLFLGEEPGEAGAGLRKVKVRTDRKGVRLLAPECWSAEAGGTRD